MGGNAVVKPGVAASVADTATLGDQLGKIIQQISKTGSALPPDAAESLRNIMQRRMASLQKPYDTLVANTKKIADKEGIDESLWHIDADPSAPAPDYTQTTTEAQKSKKTTAGQQTPLGGVKIVKDPKSGKMVTLNKTSDGPDSDWQTWTEAKP